MAKEPPHRHNGGPLSDEDRAKLWNHVRAREVLNEQMDEVRLDIAARKGLIKSDGFDVNMVELILKRRKAGEGETRTADELIRIYEDGLRDQGALPLEQTRAASRPPRRDVDEIAQELHGEPAPPMPEKELTQEDKLADAFCELARSGLTIARVPPTSIFDAD